MKNVFSNLVIVCKSQKSASSSYLKYFTTSFFVSASITLSDHETADFSSIQIAVLIITDHYRANYYLAKFFVKHRSHKIEPFDLKKRVFLKPEKPKYHMKSS